MNSHLANNPDLVRLLEKFEGAWELADRYLIDRGPMSMKTVLLHLYGAVQKELLLTQDEKFTHSNKSHTSGENSKTATLVAEKSARRETFH